MPCILTAMKDFSTSSGLCEGMSEGLFEGETLQSSLWARDMMRVGTAFEFGSQTLK